MDSALKLLFSRIEARIEDCRRESELRDIYGELAGLVAVSLIKVQELNHRPRHLRLVAGGDVRAEVQPADGA